MKAIVYVRQSQDRTGEQLAVTRQRDDCERLASLRGWNVVATHSDNDTSAAGRKQRPGFQAVLAAVESGSAQVVVAWSLDRLTRNRRDQIRLVETCEKAGAIIALVRGSDIDMSTPSGRLVADVLGGVARHEIDQKSDRQRNAALQAAKQGRRVGGRRPFGYEADGVTPAKMEAQAVRDAYRMLLDGDSLGSIARNWNERGLHTPQGKRDGTPASWTAQVVSRTLRKPGYAGLRAYRGEIVGEAQWPGLVDSDVWHAAQAVLRDPSRRTPGGERALLTGVALCGVCGATMHAGGARRHYPMYRCSGSFGHVNRMAAPVEAFVSAVVIERMSRPDAADLLIDRDRPDVASLREESDVLRQRLDAMAEDCADGIITRSQLRAGTARIQTRQADLDDMMADSARADVLAPLVSAADVGSVWNGLSVDRRRLVIGVLFEVTLLPPGRGTRLPTPTGRDDHEALDKVGATVKITPRE